MATWAKEEIELQGGAKALAQMPVIISASRSTDIPAFYSDWFMARLKDSGRRLSCGCIMAKDVGEYNTCPPTPTTPQRWRTGGGIAPARMRIRSLVDEIWKSLALAARAFGIISVRERMTNER